MKKLLWQTGLPPKGKLVEVRNDEIVSTARAIYGDAYLGVRPHWESEDGNAKFGPNYFQEWRLLPNGERPKQESAERANRRIKPVD